MTARSNTARVPPPASEPGVELVRVVGVPFRALSFEDAVARIRCMIESGGVHQVVLANAHTVNIATADPSYRTILENAALVLRDGVGVELASRLRGRRLAYNFVGTDFVPNLVARLGADRIGVFLYGGRPGVAEEAAHALAARVPDVRVLGTEHGFGDAESATARIRAARPDLLLVALGNPHQERWIAAHLQELDARVAIGVGALFDYLAGRVVRAPSWVRELRSEWLFRLLVEPRRLWRRYVLGNPTFLWHAWRTRTAERA